MAETNLLNFFLIPNKLQSKYLLKRFQLRFIMFELIYLNFFNNYLYLLINIFVRFLRAESNLAKELSHSSVDSILQEVFFCFEEK